MTNDTITIYRKDTPTIEMTIYDYTGSAVFDISSYTVQMMVKKNESDADSAAAITVTGTVTDGPGGMVQFALTETLASVTPGTYFYDVQIKNASANKVYTVSKGSFIVTRDIRRAGIA